MISYSTLFCFQTFDVQTAVLAVVHTGDSSLLESVRVQHWRDRSVSDGVGNFAMIKKHHNLNWFEGSWNEIKAGYEVFFEISSLLFHNYHYYIRLFKFDPINFWSCSLLISEVGNLSSLGCRIWLFRIFFIFYSKYSLHETRVFRPINLSI